MLVLENKCPGCYGNLILDEAKMTATCEDCGASERARDKGTFTELLEDAVIWGPKEKRLEPSPMGNLILNNIGLLGYLRRTLKEAIRGRDLEDYDLVQLKKWELVEDEEQSS